MMELGTSSSALDPARLVVRIRRWGRELGFQEIRIAGIELGDAAIRLRDWLDRGYHGEMHYMSRHGTRRARPEELVPGTLSVICARMDYLRADTRDAGAVLEDRDRAFVARYALGRDYHKVLRTRLEKLSARVASEIVPHRYRVFTDSAPVMEVALARSAGLGWRGKHTLLLSREHGSYFFLGEIYTDLALPPDPPVSDHCGSCTRCIEVCPTQAIVAPYVLDARRCISYLTIEHPGSIPEVFRPLIGNRVYGCDDCQMVCPWNRFARPSGEAEFDVRNGLDDAALVDLFAWTRREFEDRMAGSAIRRIGYERWLRNLAVGLGNAADRAAALRALGTREDDPSVLVREHVAWAMRRQERPA